MKPANNVKDKSAVVIPPRYQFHDLHPPKDDFLGDVIKGLSASTKSLPPKYFYDQQGSQLFDQITELQEYYPTRTEIGILRANASDIATTVDTECILIELGSGSSLKIRLLLDAIRPQLYLPIDISGIHLQASAQALTIHFPELAIHAICADYSRHIKLPDRVANQARESHRLVFFPGSSIGNFTPAEATDFLKRVATMAGPDSGLLIGVDLIKDKAILEAAYNDASGVTAAFNLNLLTRINRELDANFDIECFSHHALYNSEEKRIEMHLESLARQQVTIGKHHFSFAKGETLHTENSYKYDIDQFQSLAACAGYQSEKVWIDPQRLFSLHYFRLTST